MWITSLYNVLAAVVFRLPIVIIQLIHPDALTGGGVDKLAVAQVNAAEKEASLFLY